MNPLSEGAVKSLRGLRTGDSKTLYTGVFLLVYGLWKRNRDRRDLIHRQTLKPGDAMLIRARRADGKPVLVPEALAMQLKRR